MYQRLKTTFLYGMFVIIPIALTIWIVVSLIQLISGPVSSLFGQSISQLSSFGLSILLITVVGFLTKNYLGQAVIATIESVLLKIPLIRLIYKSIKQVANSLSFKQKALSCVLIEYPRKGTYALGWITNENPFTTNYKTGDNVVEDLISVFVPTTPNPTSGYFLYLKKEDCQELDISIEDSIKLLMSAGVLDNEVKSV